MKPPTISEQIGGYLIEYVDEHLQVKASRIHVHSDGRVTGELEIIHLNGKSNLILMPSSQFNFSAERTRAQQAKQLSEKHKTYKINWTEVFDFLGHKVQELARLGEPVDEVWLEDDVTAPELLLEPIIYKGVPNIIFGEKGVNKSTLVYLFGICLALPWYDNPFGLKTTMEPIKTLVLDWETDRAIFRYYLSRMKRGMNIPAVPLYYRRCRLPLAEDLEAIEKHINTYGIEVLLIDSLGAAAGGESGELKGSQSALSFFAGLRKLKTTSLIIAQTKKGDDPHVKRSIFGSTFFTYYARNVFELCKQQEEESDIYHLALFHRESNLGKKSRPIGFRMIFDDSQNTLKVEREPVSAAEFAERVSIGQRLYVLLKSGPKTAKELKEETGVGYPQIGTAMARLKAKGLVTKVGDQWGLTSQEERES